MTFNTFVFYPIFATITLIYFIVPKKWRWVWLLISSYFLYSLSDIRFAAILLVCTGIAFFIGLLIDHSRNNKLRKFWMTVGVSLIIGTLFLFKYLSFFFDTFNTLLSAAGVRWYFRGLELIIPIGISFFSLQIVGYILDVYNGRLKAERNFGYFALFVSFFPKLLIGPIERYKNMAPQLINQEPFKYEEFTDNLLRIGWGLFKKIIAADRLAVVANTVFASPQDFGSPKLITAILAFSFQIYFDFSAYSDIAIGISKIIGIQLTENFNYPYFASSIIDFWRRWHISLSNWLRDYIFLPLNYRHGRKRPRKLWIAIDVMVVFLISGLWHGANWTYIFWGALHGLYQSIEILTQSTRDRLVKFFNIDRTTFAHQLLQMLFTFGLVCFAWLFFKASSISDSSLILKSIFKFKDVTSSSAWLFGDGSLGLDINDIWIMCHTTLLIFAVDWISRKHNILSALSQQPTWFRWAVYIILIFSIAIFGFYGQIAPENFIYFQF
jgi:alginate O-acetyltransferase complex protein AlgI